MPTKRKKATTKTPKPKKKTQVQNSVAKYRDLILTGSMLVIDPSSGSEGSMPGYSIWFKGSIISYGTIRLPAGAELHLRLQELARTLREEFDVPDILAIENIAPFVNGFNRSVLNLHKGIGVTIASVPCPRLVEISPGSWHAKLKQLGIHDSYVKSDVNDAIWMGYCIVCEAHLQAELEMPYFDFKIIQRVNT